VGLGGRRLSKKYGREAYTLAPILKSFVPQTGHDPVTAGFLFFIVTFFGFFTSRFCRHLTQYA
jgi:hypothetical protein